ncbi:Integral membrane protein OS=Streptomyces glaucescens OX=1907 GN=SGLAU_03710 PE=4 SV=1 [Streptomyces glaucescens]
MRALSGLWRWRRNPLCRATDLAEARLALTALLLMVLVAPLLGVLVGSATQESLHRAAREQRLTRHQVTATVLRGPSTARPTPRPSPATPAPESSPAGPHPTAARTRAPSWRS